MLLISYSCFNLHLVTCTSKSLTNLLKNNMDFICLKFLNHFFLQIIELDGFFLIERKKIYFNRGVSFGKTAILLRRTYLATKQEMQIKWTAVMPRDFEGPRLNCYNLWPPDLIRRTSNFCRNRLWNQKGFIWSSLKMHTVNALGVCVKGNNRLYNKERPHTRV